MAQVMKVLLVHALVIATAWSCRPDFMHADVDVDLNLNPEYHYYQVNVYNIYADDHFWDKITRWKRSTSDKELVFSRLDSDGNGFIASKEWKAENGSIINFTKFLQDMDEDGDEMISLKEFNALSDVNIKFKQ